MNRVDQLKSLLIRFEPLLFWLCALAFIAPIWLAVGIYTYDGPAHMYNAQQLWELLFQHNQWLSQFYKVNTGPDNWLTHGLLMFLQAGFGAATAERIWFSLYVFVFVAGFRLWLLQLGQPALSWWVFLLLYFFNVLLGQYSFAFSVALFPFFMVYWQRYLAQKKGFQLIAAAVFLVLIYLSHVVTFAVAGLAAGLLVVSSSDNIQQKGSFLLQLFGIALPGLVLTALFMGEHADGSSLLWLPWAERWQHILHFRSLIVYSYTEDMPWTRLVAALFAGLFVIGIYRNRRQWQTFLPWLLIWASVLLCALFAPDQASGGGFIQTRLNLLFILLSVALLASFRGMTRVYWCVLPLVLFVSFRLGTIHYNANHNLAVHRAVWEKIDLLIPAESTVVTYNFSPSWLQHHIHTLVGQNRPLVHLSNYEADNNYFPLRWQKDEKLHEQLVYWVDTRSMSPCGPAIAPKTQFLPDYIICYFHEIKGAQGCNAMLDQLLASSYNELQLQAAPEIKLYKKRLK